MIDLMSIARTEADGGDLQGLLSGLFEPTDVRPTGYPDAVVWQGGNHDGSVNPVAHSLTDAFALLGTVAAIDVLRLPFYAVPMWSQIRHDLVPYNTNPRVYPLRILSRFPISPIPYIPQGRPSTKNQLAATQRFQVT